VGLRRGLIPAFRTAKLGLSHARNSISPCSPVIEALTFLGFYFCDATSRPLPVPLLDLLPRSWSFMPSVGDIVC
jgi:hypothetical protein